MLFKNAQSGIFKAPVSGTVIPVEGLHDPVFSRKLLGETIAIVPKDDTIVSPCDGQIVMVADTLHAIGIKAKNGAEILLHIGLDTCYLHGEGFQLLCKQGKKVRAGQKLLNMDLVYFQNKNVDSSVIMIMTNAKDFHITLFPHTDVLAGKSKLLEITN